MSYQTHDLAEWAAFLSLGLGVHAAYSVPYFLLVDFDPRCLLDTRAGDRLCVEIVRAKGSVQIARDRALVIVTHLSPSAPTKGAHR